MHRAFRVVVTAAALVAFGATAATAQEYPPNGGNLGVSAGTVAPGGSVTVSGAGCAPTADVALAIDSADAGNTSADTAGSFSAQVTVPSDAAGSVEITATCDEADAGVLVLRATVSIQSSGGGLPFTGVSNPFPTTLAALAVLVVGAGLVLVARRRSLALSRS